MAKRHKNQIHNRIHRPVTRQALQTRESLMDSLRHRPGVLHPLDLSKYYLGDLRDVEDLRRLPKAVQQQRQFKLIHGTSAPYGRKPVPVRHPVPWLREKMSVQFHFPERTAVCVRRKARRRVLFAMRKTSGTGRRKKARWTAKSYIQCR